jgi:GH18 family chitinase
MEEREMKEWKSYIYTMSYYFFGDVRNFSSLSQKLYNDVQAWEGKTRQI